MARVTLAEVADKADVSVSAVSVVLNGRAKERRLSDDCVQRVHAAARQLGYRGNYGARTLARGKAMTLGFVAKYVAGDPARPRIETGFEREANDYGYEVLTLCLGPDESPLERALDYVKQGRIDGFAIYVGGWTTLPAVAQIPPGVPVCHVYYHPESFRPVVTLAPEPGIREAVRHLASLGHRRVAWIGIEQDGQVQLPERLDAFRDASGEAGLETVEHCLADTGLRAYDLYRGLEPARSVLSGATAALCYNDIMARALAAALRDAGLRVPEDVALVGFDNTSARDAIPPLTTISHSFVEMGRAAMRHLASMVEEGRERSEEIIRVPSRLIVRRSTTGESNETNR